MYGNRPNVDLETMMDKVSTPNRLRAPTPIRKVPVRMMPTSIPNKENVSNTNNQWISQPNNRNYQDMQHNKPMGMPNDAAKKPLISPVRNPFKTQIQNMHGEDNRNTKNTGRQPMAHMLQMPQVQHIQQMQLQNNANDNQFCTNHPNKLAEFNIDIEDECMAYCGRCAAQLASQGFQVTKIQQMTVKKSDPKMAHNQQNIQTRQLPRYPEYEGNPMYELILQFLTQLSQVQNEHLQNMTKLTMIDNHYLQQIDHTKDFYTELMTFIEQMRDDHLNDLYQESRKHSQIADIEHDYLRENVDQMSNIRNDIEENLETIVEKLDEDDLRNNLNYYKQKIQVYRHKVEEQSQFFDKLINFSPQEYQSKLSRVQEFLMDVWNNQSEPMQMQPMTHHQPQNQAQKFMPVQTRPMPAFKQPDFALKQPNPMQVMQMHQNKNMPQNNTKKPTPVQTGPEQQPAFRRLFEEEEPVMAQTSPQFKKI